MTENDNTTAAHVVCLAMAYGLMVDECAQMPIDNPYRLDLLREWQQRYDAERAVAESLFGIDRVKMDEFELAMLDMFAAHGLPLI